MLPLAILVHGHYYAGQCRNARVARWDAAAQVFHHWRQKFGHRFVETIDYWDDDGQYDGFIPVFDLGPEPPEAIELPLPPPTTTQ
jgi:hypothetical protein